MILQLILLGVGYLVLKWLLEKVTVGKYGERYVLITGCDTGFGNLLSKKLDSLGFHVFAGCLTEKGEEELKKSCSEKLVPFHLDVSKEENIEKALEFVGSKLPRDKGLWAVVNNAGVCGDVGPSEMMRRDSFQRCLSVNLFGMIDTTRASLPLLRKAKGRIVNLTSIMGRCPGATAPYSVSKFGGEAYSDVLRREVLCQGLTVHLVEPGLFRTTILNIPAMLASYQRCFQQSDAQVQELYGQGFVDHVRKTLDMAMEKSNPNVTLVVDALTHAVTARFPRYRYVVGWDAKLIFRSLAFLPEWVGDWLLTLKAAVPEGLKKS